MRDVAPLALLHVASDPTAREVGSINGSITARLDPLMDSRRGVVKRTAVKTCSSANTTLASRH